MTIIGGGSLIKPKDAIPNYGSSANPEDIVNFHKLLVKRYGSKTANEVFIYAYNKLNWKSVRFTKDQVNYFKKYGIDVNVQGGLESFKLSISNVLDFIPIKQIILISGIIVIVFYAIRFVPMIRYVSTQNTKLTT